MDASTVIAIVMLVLDATFMCVVMAIICDAIKNPRAGAPVGDDESGIETGNAPLVPKA